MQKNGQSGGLMSVLRKGVLSGAAASVLSSLALALCGKNDSGSHFAATNAISHWIWGPKAARRNGASMKYTFVGYAIHHGCSTFWATCFEMALQQRKPRSAAATLATVAAAAAATSAVAYWVDYNLTPQRLQPGFEQRLSKKSLFVVYAAFAAGLALAAHCRRQRQDA